MKRWKSKYFVQNAVKEGLDNLPDGVVFFNQKGWTILANHTMHTLSFALSGRDFQSYDDFIQMLKITNYNSTVDNDKNIYILPKKTVWRFSEEQIEDKYGCVYTQITASDITELYAKKTELETDRRELEEMKRQLQKLSANVVVMSREEELLSMKMRVHDDMGRSLLAVRQILRQKQPIEAADKIIDEWSKSLELLTQQENDSEKRDMMSELTALADGLIKIKIGGNLPKQSDEAYLIVCAVRECITNAVRHAHATELLADLQEENNRITAKITNNGIAPQKEIVEGGGLTTLRSRVERAGGMMTVQSVPVFELTVSLPLGKEVFDEKSIDC